MKVKTRLSLYCSILFSIVFAAISILLYSLYSKNAEDSIYNDLAKNTHISALFYLEEDELSAKEFEKIKAQFNEIVSPASYQVYNEQDSVVYGVDSFRISSTILDQIRHRRRMPFSDNSILYYGIFYEDNQGDFVVIAKEDRDVLQRQMDLLLWILLPLFSLGVLAIIILSRWVANIAYRPFSNAIQEVNNISTNNLDVQIKSPHTKDELQDLIDTFNNLLSKVSETVVIQKNFVKYVSHEFKTPLASMLGNLDLFTIKDRSPEEYHQLSEKLIQQIFQMQEILETLIVVSDLKKDEISAGAIRIDELIWEIIDKMKYQHSSSKIFVNIDVQPEDEALMFVNVDRTQLIIALFNLIENAVKYSLKENVEIRIAKVDNSLCLSIIDKGIGIPPEQLSHISKPFYRANNTDEIKGSGIGLSLALRILDKNKIEYSIHSELNVGTHIDIYFNKIL